MTNSTLTSDEKRIRELDAEWGKAANLYDVDAVMKFYSTGATLVWPDQPKVFGQAEITKAWTDMFRNYKNLSLRFDPTQIDVASDRDLAIDFGEVTLEYESPKKQEKVIAKYLVVWKRISDDWKVLYDSYNSNESACP